MCCRIFVFLLFFLGNSAIAQVQEKSGDPLEALQAARKSRDEALREESTALTKAFDDAIANAAKARNSALLKALLAELDAFNLRSAAPTSKVLESESKKYLERRRMLDRELRSAYLAAIQQLDLLGRRADASAMEDELAAFVEKEKQILSGQGGAPAELGKSNDIDDLSAAKDEFKGFCEFIGSRITKIGEEETTLKKQHAADEMAKALAEKKLQSRWVVDFPVSNVRAVGASIAEFELLGPNGYVFPNLGSVESGGLGAGFGAPLGPGLGFPRPNEGKATWELRKKIQLPIKRDDALRVRAGDIVRLRGRPVVYIRDARTAGTVPSTKYVLLFQLRYYHVDGSGIEMFIDFILQDFMFQVIQKPS